MASLTQIERIRLEKFLDMGTGYVLKFSNRTFRDFVLETIGKDIHEQVKTFLSEHGMHSDYEYEYEYEYEITHKDDNSFMALHKLIPIEHDVFNTALDIDDNFERLNRQYLNEEFLFKNYQRFSFQKRTVKNGQFLHSALF